MCPAFKSVTTRANLEAATGCTVVICEDGAVGGVDVRGSAPGTRETDLAATDGIGQRSPCRPAQRRQRIRTGGCNRRVVRYSGRTKALGCNSAERRFRSCPPPYCSTWGLSGAIFARPPMMAKPPAAAPPLFRPHRAVLARAPARPWARCSV